MKYTGKKYVAIDNSYSINLSNELKNEHIAGSKWNVPLLTTIITEPFKVNIPNRNGANYHEFVIVETEHKQNYFVLFFEHGLITKTNDFESFLRKNKEFQEEEF